MFYVFYKKKCFPLWIEDKYLTIEKIFDLIEEGWMTFDKSLFFLKNENGKTVFNLLCEIHQDEFLNKIDTVTKMKILI